jgi:serine/threonine protein kinase
VTLTPGARLGRYEVLGLLSIGGMAEVYLARVAGLAGFEKLVALKRMLPHLTIQPGFVEMFLAEARLAAMLDHPNVAQVHDIGEDTGNYYYAMELIRGADLRQLMKAQSKVSGGVPLHCAIAIGLGMCAGLEHAHELRDHLGQPLGVVHRDVSLSNVMVSYDGTVKITDFGVAKLTSNDARTRTGTLKGKIGYMSPEQCRGEQLDRRSDVFAIGIILYELVTGRRLFRPDGSEFAILQKIIREDATPPSQYRPDLPAGLEAIIMLALQRDRRLRYQTARDMQRDLEALAREQRLPASPIELGEYVRSLVPQKPLQIESSRRNQNTRSKIEVPSGLWGHQTDDDFGLPVAEATSQDDLRATPGLGAPAIPDSVPTRKPSHRPPITMPMRALDKHKVAIALLGAALAGVFFAIVGVLALRGTEPAPPPPGPTVAVNVSPSTPTAAPAAAARPRETHAAAAPRIANGIEDALLAVDPGQPLETDMPSRPARAVRAVSDDHRDARRPREDERRPARVPARAAAPQRQARIAADPNPTPAPEPAPPPAAEPPPIDAGVRPAATEPPIDAAPPAPRPVAPKPTPAPPTRVDPGSMDAVAAIASVDVSGPIQDSEIRRGLSRVTGAFRECYRDAARAAKKTPAGKVKLSFQIDETRAARKIQASGAPLPGLGSCIEDAAGSIRTRIAPDVGNAQVKVTITFDPTGS